MGYRKGLARLGIPRPAHLQPQQAPHHLQVVLHPMMQLLQEHTLHRKRLPGLFVQTGVVDRDRGIVRKGTEHVNLVQREFSSLSRIDRHTAQDTIPADQRYRKHRAVPLLDDPSGHGRRLKPRVLLSVKNDNRDAFRNRQADCPLSDRNRNVRIGLG